MKYFAYIPLLFFSLFLKAQNYTLKRVDSIDVYQNGDRLGYPWVGGLNNPQLSTSDLNNDGIKDLFVFDRMGSRINVFINNNKVDTPSYHFVADYRSQFPSLQYWTLLRDFDCDGKEDIFSSSNGGIRIHRNNSTSTETLFDLYVSELLSDYHPSMVNLYVSLVDIPAIEDLDGDGDLDILSFPPGGTNIEYHKNYSKENGLCDIKNMQLEKQCWGKFSEDNSTNAVYLNDSTGYCLNGFRTPSMKSGSILHAGSTITAYDMDGDSDYDAMLGDISFPRLVYLHNNGTSTYAKMDSQDPDFPSYNVTADIDIFPAAFMADVNNDGKKDMIVAPNAQYNSDNYNNVWYYKNVGSGANSMFEFAQSDFLQHDMIDVGEGAYPSFLDYNSDGRLDLVIGNYGYKEGNVFISKLALYKNIGSNNVPRFQLITRDFSSLSALSDSTKQITGLAPCFGDIDGDGDVDMICGNTDGTMLYFQNTAGAGNTVNFVLTDTRYLNIDVGNYSKPTLFDLNNDGRLDLIVGGKDGKFAYFQDMSASGAASFSLITRTLGNVILQQYPNSSNGYSNPAFIRQNGKTKMYTGSYLGWILCFDNIDNNLSGTFNLVDTLVGNFIEGRQTCLAFANLNSDTIPEVVIGNYCGGVALYNFEIYTGQKEISNGWSETKVYPNPAKNSLIIESPVSLNGNYVISDLTGKVIQSETLTAQKTIVNLDSVVSGFYFVIVSSSSGKKYTSKLIVSK